MKTPGIYLFLVALLACGQGPINKHVKQVFKGPLFRNQQLGYSYTRVMKSEESKWMQFPDSNMIKYHYQISDSDDFHWAYMFTNDRLSQIHLESFLGSEQRANQYVTVIKNKYNDILGVSKEKGDVYEWRNDSVMAVLFNESKAANMGYVRMVFSVPGDSITTMYDAIQ